MITENSLLSVVIPTLGRPDVLARTLRHLAAQSVPPRHLEIIVCEDGCTEETARVVGEARAHGFQRLEFLQNDGHRGPGFTQNKGIRAAQCSLVLLLADDIWLEPGAVQAHLDMHSCHPQETAAVLGRVEQSPELAGSTFIKHWNPFNFAKLVGREHLPYYYFWGCNISFKREFVVRNGLFLEHRGRAADGRGSGGAAHEDVELGYRLHQQGLELFLAPDAWGYHYHLYTLEQATKRYYERGLNFGEIHRYVPDPEILVQNHVLTTDTWRDYASVFRRSNGLTGREASFAWHVLRQIAFHLLVNRVTETALWRPLLDGAEKRPALASLVSGQLYRTYLYAQFMRGIHDARMRYAEATA
ncbi:MAG: glycosyltransferase [Pseudomonadota bacterium]|nr:glycosyltransferase [Pseudomonadota bacterium]